MIRLVPRLKVGALASVCLMAAGCPGGLLTPVVNVSPAAISFDSSAVQRPIIIFNSGDIGSEFTWTAREVRRQGDVADNIWIPAEVPFLSIEPNSAADGTVTGEDLIEGGTTNEIDQINVVADRTGLPPGLYSGYGIEIESSAGTQVVAVSLNVIQALDVSPTFVSIQPNSNTATFTIRNIGPLPLPFTIEAISDPEDPDSTIDLPEYIVSLPLSGSVLADSEQAVVMTIDRTGLDPEVFVTHLLVSTSSGAVVVTITFGVGGAGVFSVTPPTIAETVNVFGSSETRQLDSIRIDNPGTEPVEFSLSFEEGDEDLAGVPATLPSFVTIEPLTGTVAAGRFQELTVTLDPAGMTSDTPPVDINIVVTAEGVGSQFVHLLISTTEGPRLSVQQEPPFRTFGSLDFGRENDILALGVGNTGGVGTTLEFRLQNADPSALIKLPPVSEGRSTANECLFSEYITCHDWQQFSIVIDRTAINPLSDSDGGTFEIVAIDNLGNVIPDIAPIKIAVSVERAPLRIEGATNRSRPPRVMRFVFLLRDSLLQAIDTLDPDVLRNLNFDIEENDIPLELDETNFFVEGPENLVQNLVILLDFTGSMLNAGATDAPPAAQGQRIAEMRESVAHFIRRLDQLPETYRISIQEYHERNQIDREIHPFSTDTDSLIAALENFSLPVADHGESEIFDALGHAVNALAGQDSAVITFDEADVRSVVFVSDGNDTSSGTDLNQLIDSAKENRVRLFPVSFGDNVNFGNLVPLAGESGGSNFNVIGSRTLADFFGTADDEGQIWHDLQRQLTLTYISLIEGDSTYNITASFEDETGANIAGQFERDAVVFPGDSRAGQLSLLTSGISAGGTAEVIVRLDYAPRNITQFRFRFIVPPAFRDNLADEDVELISASDDEGLMNGWRMAPEGDDVFSVVTDLGNPLAFGAFGNMMRLTFRGLAADDEFAIGFRADNTLYQQADPESSVNTKFFLYPGAHTNPDGVLIVGENSSLAGPGESVLALLDTTFDPEAESAYDRDLDGILDFDDADPADADIPASLIAPRLLSFPVGVDENTVTLTNNLLDTLEWEVDFDFLTAIPLQPLFANVPLGTDRITFGPSFGVITPGGSNPVLVTIDRAGLAPGAYTADVNITTNLTPDPVLLRLSVVVE